jgi:hypothetical protein
MPAIVSVDSLITGKAVLPDAMRRLRLAWVTSIRNPCVEGKGRVTLETARPI